MEHAPPTWGEARAILFPTGCTGLIGLAAWADAVPERHLWAQNWFDLTVGVLAVMTLLGLYGFIAHWKARSIAPVIMVVAIAVAQLWHPIALISWALFALAFGATIYAAAPERVSKAPITGLSAATNSDLEYALKVANEALQDACEARDSAQLELAALKLAPSRSQQSEPALAGKITAFQEDARPMTPGMPNYGGVCYAVHLEIENFGAPSRIRDWEFPIYHEGGMVDMGPLVLGQNKWAALPSWPQIEYYSLDEVQNEYIQPGKVYHVLFHIAVSVISHPIKAFEVRFKDGDGREVICAQASP